MRKQLALSYFNLGPFTVAVRDAVNETEIVCGIFFFHNVTVRTLILDAGELLSHFLIDLLLFKNKLHSIHLKQILLL